MVGHNRLLALADLASAQWGIVTTAQAATVGVTALRLSRLARDGYLSRIRHGVYKIAGSPGHPHDDIRAAWLATDPRQTRAQRLEHDQPEAVLSHRSAALVHHIGDLDADRIEFTAESRKQPRDSGVRFHRGDVAPDRWTLVDGLPVTTVLVTIEDLAAARIDGGHLAGMVRDALGRDLVDPDALQQALRPYAHWYGAALGDGDQLIGELLRQAAPSQATLRAATGSITAMQRIIAQNTLTPETIAAVQRFIAQNTITPGTLAAVQRIIAQNTLMPGNLAAIQSARATKGEGPKSALPSDDDR